MSFYNLFIVVYVYLLQDAHNAIADFDTNASFFAVYDGHGGSEVSAYCALRFPDYLKQIEAYKSGDIDKALKEAFIGFDATLLEENVIEALKSLAKKLPEGIDPDDDSGEEENLADLCQEARMPLKDVLKKYEEYKQNPNMARLQDEATGSSSSLKPISPFLKAKAASSSSATGTSTVQNAGPSASASSSSSMLLGGASSSGCSSSSSIGPSSSRRSLDVDDTTVSSSSGKADGTKPNDASEVTGSWAGSNGRKQECDVPDSSSTSDANDSGKILFATDSSEVTQSTTLKLNNDVNVTTNGDISGSEIVETSKQINSSSVDAEIESSTGKTESVTSSSSKIYENGEVSSNTNNGGDGISGASNNISSTEQKIADSSTDDSEDEPYEGKFIDFLKPFIKFI